MHDTPDVEPAPPEIIHLRGRGPRQLLGARIETSVRHAQRIEDLGLQEAVQRRSGDLLHQERQGHDADVRVDRPVPRLVLQRLPGDGGPVGFPTLDLQEPATERRQPRRVGEEVSDRHGGLPRISSLPPREVVHDAVLHSEGGCFCPR